MSFLCQQLVEENAMNVPISDCEFRIATRKQFQQLAITNLRELARWTELELLAIKGFGSTSLAEVKMALTKHRLRLKSNRRILVGNLFSVRVSNCLKQHGITSVEQLASWSEEELLSFKSFGETSLAEVREVLASHGLTLISTVTLRQPISSLKLSVRAGNCLEAAGIETVGDLVKKSEANLLRLCGFGKTSLYEVYGRLAELGLRVSEDSERIYDMTHRVPEILTRKATAYLRGQGVDIIARNGVLCIEPQKPASPTITMGYKGETVIVQFTSSMSSIQVECDGDGVMRARWQK